jgi:twitching motility protein PilT
VFGTLHTVNAVQTVDRIVDVFPIHQQQQVRMQLSVNLVGVMSQTLVRRRDGRGRIAAHEVMVATSAVRNLIRENKTYQISSIIQTGARAKMHSLDQSLAQLVEKSLVDHADAKARAMDPGEFERLVAVDTKPRPQQHTPQVQPGQPGYVQPPPVASPAARQPYRQQFRKH